MRNLSSRCRDDIGGQYALALALNIYGWRLLVEPASIAQEEVVPSGES